MKQIEVVAAIIHDAVGRIFATQRGYGEWQGYWEFPGGKMEAGESPEAALRRAIWEALATRISIRRLVASGRLELKEHAAARWLHGEELESVDWLPADRNLVQKLKTMQINSIN